MELNEDQKRALKELGDAINLAVEASDSVNDALDQLRELGYEAELNLKLEVALQEIESIENDESSDLDFEFTDDDLQTLKRMKIAAD